MRDTTNLCLIHHPLQLYRDLLDEIPNLHFEDGFDDFAERSQDAMKVMLDSLYIYVYQDEIGSEIRRAVAIQRVDDIFNESSDMAMEYDRLKDAAIDPAERDDHILRNVLSCLIMDKTSRVLKALVKSKPECFKNRYIARRPA